MEPEQIDRAIAEHLGWTGITSVPESARLWGAKPGSKDAIYRIEAVHQFHKCLNALADAVKSLDYDQSELFAKLLDDIVGDDRKAISEDNPPPYEFAIMNATAAQRREALLRVIGKYQDPEKLSTHQAV